VNAIVVVDECDFSSQTRIWNQLQLHGPRIKLVSIYNDSEEAAGTTVVQDALPLDARQITEIVSFPVKQTLLKETQPRVEASARTSGAAPGRGCHGAAPRCRRAARCRSALAARRAIRRDGR